MNFVLSAAAKAATKKGAATAALGTLTPAFVGKIGTGRSGHRSQSARLIFAGPKTAG